MEKELFYRVEALDDKNNVLRYIEFNAKYLTECFLVVNAYYTRLLQELIYYKETEKLEHIKCHKVYYPKEQNNENQTLKSS